MGGVRTKLRRRRAAYTLACRLPANRRIAPATRRAKMIAMGQMRLTPVKGKAAGEGSISGDGTLVGGYWANALEAVTTRAPTAHPSRTSSRFITPPPSKDRPLSTQQTRQQPQIWAKTTVRPGPVTTWSAASLPAPAVPDPGVNQRQAIVELPEHYRFLGGPVVGHLHWLTNRTERGPVAQLDQEAAEVGHPAAAEWRPRPHPPCRGSPRTVPRGRVRR